MTDEPRKIYIFSAGSTGRDILQIINQINNDKIIWKVLGFVDSNKKLIGKKIDGIKVYKALDLPVSNKYYAICGHSDPKIRKKIINNEIIKHKYNLAKIIHPNVIKPNNIKISKGVVIFAGVIISYNVKIQNCCWIDANVKLGHDTIIESYSSIFPSVTINGNCKIGSSSIIGSGSIISTGSSIGKNSSIGVGTIVTNNIPNNTTMLNFQRVTKKSIK